MNHSYELFDDYSFLELCAALENGKELVISQYGGNRMGKLISIKTHGSNRFLLEFYVGSSSVHVVWDNV